MEAICYRPIGIVRSPCTDLEGMPLQSVAAGGIVVRLLAVAGSTLEVAGLDLVDGTPVLDVKPYVPAFDSVQAERSGWLQHKADRVHHVRADGRFDET